MEELISVIVCTYNQESTIGRTLDSILMQQCSLPVEIVIGEDCSTDGTLAVCQRYAAQYPDRITLFANAENKGIVDNYFDCLLAARGRYIADCAGDDFWVDATKLEKQLKVLRAHPEVTLVHTDWLFYNEQTKQPMPHEKRTFDAPFTEGENLLEAILTQSRMPVIHLCSSLYRKEAFQQAYDQDTCLFRNKEFGCEDLSLTFMLARLGSIAYLPDVTLHYSVSHPSISCQDDDARQFRFVRRTTSLIHYLSQQYHVETRLVERTMQARFFALAMHAFRAHRSDLRQEIADLQKEWGLRLPMKSRCVMAVMKCEPVWRCCLVFRRLALLFKRGQ